MNKYYYATEGLAVLEFKTKSERAEFVLSAPNREVSNITTCNECGRGFVRQMDSHPSDHEFFFICAEDHFCHDDGSVVTEEEYADLEEARTFYDAD